MKKISLTKGKYAIVDNEDYLYLSRFNWFADWSKTIYEVENFYAVRFFQSARGIKNRATIPMTWFIVNAKNGCDVLHKNGNTLDNRKENLVSVPLHTIAHKSRKVSFYAGKKPTSEYKGVWWSKIEKRWKVGIAKNKKIYNLGTFKKEKEAAKAYNKKARELYGELAYQNKI